MVARKKIWNCFVILWGKFEKPFVFSLPISFFPFPLPFLFPSSLFHFPSIYSSCLKVKFVLSSLPWILLCPPWEHFWPEKDDLHYGLRGQSVRPSLLCASADNLRYILLQFQFCSINLRFFKGSMLFLASFWLYERTLRLSHQPA